MNPARTGEAVRQYGYFLDFCRQGTKRTIRQTAANLGKSASHFENLSSGYEWYRRASEYDTRVQERERELLDIQLKEMAERRARAEIRRQEEFERAARMSAQFHRVQWVELRIRKGKGPNGTDLEWVPRFAVQLRALFQRAQSMLGKDAAADHHALAKKQAQSSDSERSAVEGRKIAGSFIIGDEMYDGSDPPELPGSKLVQDEVTRVIEMPVPSQTPLIDLTGTEDLYPPKR